MELQCAREQTNCYNYNKENPLIEIIDKTEGDVMDLYMSKNCIVFLLKGEISFSSGKISNKTIKNDEMFVHPYRHKGILEIRKSSTLIIMNLNVDFSFCVHFPVESLYGKNLNANDIYPRKFNPVLKQYISSLAEYIRDGLYCTYFFELKIKEFLFLVRTYFSEKDLQLFFMPILNSDMEFSKQVFEGFKKVKTVKELAELMHYSLSGFEKRFKRVFDMPASKWIEQEKGKEIYHEITCSKRTIMEIGYNFGYSPSHFNNYCKRIFGETPKKLRNKTLKITTK